MTFHNTPKNFILLFLIIIFINKCTPDRLPSVKDILEEIAGTFGDKQLSELHPQNETNIRHGQVQIKNIKPPDVAFTGDHRAETVEEFPTEDILYQQSENLNSEQVADFLSSNTGSVFDNSTFGDSDKNNNGSFDAKDTIEKHSSHNYKNLLISDFLRDSNQNITQNISASFDAIFQITTGNNDNSQSITDSTINSTFLNIDELISPPLIKPSNDQLAIDKNDNEEMLLSIETRLGSPDVTVYENVNPENHEISFDIEIAADAFDDEKPEFNKTGRPVDISQSIMPSFRLERFARSLNSDQNITRKNQSAHINNSGGSSRVSNQEHEMKEDTEEIVSNLFDAGENPLDLLPEIDFLESAKLKEAITPTISTTDNTFIFETKSESVTPTISDDVKSVYDVFRPVSRFDLSKNRNHTVFKNDLEKTLNKEIESTAGALFNKKENLNESNLFRSSKEKSVVLEPGQNVEISVLQTNETTTQNTVDNLSSTKSDHNNPSNNDFGVINLADSMENSDASSSSHEVLLKTSSKIKEAFVITSKNNLIFFKEKRFDPAHRLRKFLHHSDLNHVKTMYPEQKTRNPIVLTSPVTANNNTTIVPSPLPEDQSCGDDCNKMGDSTSDFYFQTDSDYNKNRNERDAQNENFDPHSLSGGKKKIDVFKQLKQRINAERRFEQEGAGADVNATSGGIDGLAVLTGGMGIIDNVGRSERPVSSINYLMSDGRLPVVEATNREQPTQKGIYCDFESPCDWTTEASSGFKITSALELKNLNVGPKFDANNKTDGHFLFLQVGQTTRELSVSSPLMAPSGEACSLGIWLHQANMNASIIKVVGEIPSTDTTSTTQWIVFEMFGNSYKSWRPYNFKIGRVSHQFRILIEVLPHLSPAHVAMDNIRLIDCWPEPAIHNQCTNPRQFHCATTNVCVNVSQVCDLIHDCVHGEDEQDCDEMPFGSRCHFEDGWCGWKNDQDRTIHWNRQRDSTPNRTDYLRENTNMSYTGRTGYYLLVNMSESREKFFASTASLSSVIFNPPPPIHSNESSKYYNSCLVRFYYHLNGFHKSGLGLMITELKPKENITSQIWWSYRDNGNKWMRGVVRLPNITNRYYLQFEAKKGLRFMSVVGIDDVSLSPECFGLNIPASELNKYNYWNTLQFANPNIKETHKDFINKTYYEFSTCGARGRFGPVMANCTKAYNNTPVQVEVLQKAGQNFKGVQKWTVPGDGYYTLIAKGASGGRGSSGMGSSRGAVVRAVFDLRKGEKLYILIGQEGMNACVKSLGNSFNSSCQSLVNDNSENLTGVRGVHNMKLGDGGGGGGGATYVFLLKKDDNISVLVPLLVAAGGGGLGIGKFIDSGAQHGQEINMSKKPYSGLTRDKTKSSGAGGGFNSGSNRVPTIQNGQALQNGGAGGEACYESRGGEGTGGFGGGGGGCLMGGGGGGYSGGNAFTTNTTNGEGGTSYISPNSIRAYSDAWGGHHTGSGYLMIIPVNNECNCDYRCLALDEQRSDTICICPTNWFLGPDNTTCMLRDSATDPNILIGVLIVIVIIFTFVVGAIFFTLYNRYQHNKTEIMRRKMLSGPELQLNRLRMQSDSMMTEYNPSYEFGGVVYTLKDLHEIPRDQLRLVKALGQGAFGEVYQGFYKARQSDAVEMPVAVKTLPEMSTQQAEMDFLMEALIMSKFNHPNIVHFIGVCFDKHPRFIVLELLAGGDLKNFLRESRPKPERSSPLTMKDLVLIAVDVAKGCKYMEDNRFIHRDIAARNCLLTTKGPGRVVKIADFGMSRDIYRSDYYRKGGKAMLPIKWMPPEAFLDGIFTSKTDVWSFGVLLWEIMSMGYMPYTGCANRQVMQLVTSGGRLEPPSNCPGPVYGIMTQCWHPNPEQRPTFSQLLERLGYCIQDPDVISNPLPVFTKAPSAERDATVMRPKNPDDSYLQFPHNADYLVPTPTSGPDLQISPHDGSVETLLNDGSNDGNSDSWETSFMLPQSKSTQPLLQDNVNDTVNSNEPAVQNLINIDTPQLTPTATSPTEPNLMNHVNHNHNNNIKHVPTAPLENNLSALNIKSGVSLDASTLIQQTANGQKKPYVNVMPGNDISYATQNGPYTIDNSPHANNYVNNKKSGYLNNDSEISC